MSICAGRPARDAPLGRFRYTSVIVAGVVSLVASCSPGGDTSDPGEIPEGFEEVEASGLAFGVPSEWVEASVPEERDNGSWAGYHEWTVDGEVVAETGVITGFDDPADARAVAFQSLTLLRLQMDAPPVDRDHDYEVPGSPDSMRGDYTYEYPGEEFDEVRGADVAVMPEDGKGAVLRVTGVTEHLDDEDLEKIVRTLRVP